MKETCALCDSYADIKHRGDWYCQPCFEYVFFDGSPPAETATADPENVERAVRKITKIVKKRKK